MTLSPEGGKLAVVYAYEVGIYDLENNIRLAVLPVQESALSDCFFVNENTIVYASDHGIASYDLESNKELWTGEAATMLTVSADGNRVAAVSKANDRVIVYDTTTGTKTSECLFEGKHLAGAINDIYSDMQNNIFALNADGSLLGISFSDGSIRIWNLLEEEKSLILYDESEYRHFEGGFAGKYFAYAAQKAGSSVFGVIDTKEVTSLGEAQSQDPFMVRTDAEGIYLANGNMLVKFEPSSGEQMEMAYTNNANILGFAVSKDYVITATDDKRFSFYDSGAHLLSDEQVIEICDFVRIGEHYAVVGNRNELLLRILELEDYTDATLCSYDAHYEHEEARVSVDGSTVMLFGIHGFRIYKNNDELISEVDLPNAEEIYDQQYQKNKEKCQLEVIWYDGTIRKYDALNGTLLLEEKGEVPAKDLEEEFVTEKYRIHSTLHKAPEVFDRKTDKRITSLEEEGNLTYVTQIGEYLVTEYISAAGDRYGLLLDENLEIIAYLPNLCDVNNGMFVFDYESGKLRQSHIYSLQELIDLGENYNK